MSDLNNKIVASSKFLRAQAEFYKELVEFKNSVKDDDFYTQVTKNFKESINKYV